jgi:carbon-monoxide dehydrogenase medium subunit
MFPANFEYVAATSVDEALSVLSEQGDEAKVLAGGQSLIPLLKLRFAAPGTLVDINRIPGLDTLSLDGGRLRVGALVRHRDAERSDLLASRFPTMSAAAPLISDPLVRNLGTVVGSLCHADPQGDWGAVMLALGGELVVRSRSGERTIPVGELIDGPFMTTLRPDELATEVRVPDPGEGAYGTYLKLERKVGDFATVGVAVALSMNGGRVERAGIALTAVGPTNLKATEAEQVLAGATLEDGVIAEAARLAAAAAEPRTDIRGSAEYKREVVRVFVTRALRGATAVRAA